MGVDQAADLVDSLTRQQHHAHRLHPAGGRSGTTADDRRHHQQQHQERSEGGVIGGGIPGGRGEGDQVEQVPTNHVDPAALGQVDEEEDDHHGRDGRHPAEEEAHLRTAPVGPQGAVPEGDEMQGHRQGTEDHEHHGSHFHGAVLEVTEARIVGGEPARGHGAEGVADRVEPGHALDLVDQGAENGDAGVDEPEHLGRLRDPPRQARVLDRPGHLALVELHAAHAQQRQEGDHQHDDPQPPQPLQLLTIEQQRARQVIQPGDHRRPGRGYPRDRLEHRLGKAQAELGLQVDGRSANQAQHDPERHHDQQAVPELELATIMPRQAPEHPAQPDAQRETEHEGTEVGVSHHPADEPRRNEGQAEYHQQDAEYADDDQ